MVRPDDSVVLIDFEYAGDAGARLPARIGAAGYAAPVGTTGAEADWYALRAIWLTMLLPVAELADLDPGKTTTLEAVARRYFGLGPLAGPRPKPGRPRSARTAMAPRAEAVMTWRARAARRP